MHESGKRVTKMGTGASALSDSYKKGTLPAKGARKKYSMSDQGSILKTERGLQDGKKSYLICQEMNSIVKYARCAVGR